MGDIKEDFSQQTDAEWRASLRARGITPPGEEAPPNPTTFTGEIGIVVNILFDDGERLNFNRQIDIPGKYFGDLTAIPTTGESFGDFGEIEVPNNQLYYAKVDSNKKSRIIKNPSVVTALKKYVLEEIFDPQATVLDRSRDAFGPLEQTDYVEYDDFQNEYANFYIVPNSPVDAWIKGNHQAPYDHRAPRGFGVEYTIVRRDTGLLQGGNPTVTLIGHRLDRDDNVIPGLQATFTAPTTKFGGQLLTSDFKVDAFTQYGVAPSKGVPLGAKMEPVDLYYYSGSRSQALESYLIDQAQLDMDSSEDTRNLLVAIAGADAFGYVLPYSPMEEWIKAGDNSIPAPNFSLSYRLEVIEDPEAEEGLDVNEAEIGAGGDTKLREEQRNEEDGYEGEGSAERDVPRNDNYQDELNGIIDQIEDIYTKTYPSLNEKQPDYTLRDTNGDGDYNAADSIFGTKQGEEVKMMKTSIEFQNQTPADLVRPFDEFDNYSHEADKNIDEAKKITKRELQQFNQYASYESYYDQYQFETNTNYQDGRRDSFLIYNGNAEARIYDYYDEEYKEQRLIIAFRGTTPPSMSKPFYDTIEFVRDLMTDFSTKVQPLSYIGIETNDSEAKGIVHQGFADYVNRLYPKLLDVITHTKSIYPKVKLYITGHSLGAASSVVFSYMLFMRENIIPTRIYQFGSPMGIWTFGDMLNKNLPIINVLHTHDVVTPVSAMFKHHGIKLLFDLDGNMTPYQAHMEIPIYHHQEFIGERLLLALRKNDAYKEGTTLEQQISNIKGEGPSPLTNNEYEKIIDDFTITNLFSNLSALYENYKQPAQRRAINHAATMLGEAGLTFYHTRYKQTIDEWKNKEVLIEDFSGFSKLFKHDPNPRSFHHKHDKDYHSSIGNQHFYTGRNGEFYYGANSQSSLNFHPLNNTEPLGLIFYDKNMNFDGKAIVFYS